MWKGNNRVITVTSAVVSILFIRALAPHFILKQVNNYLATFSETYIGSISDFDLNLWRGAYSFEKFELALKAEPKNIFVTIKDADISIAWREIFKGHFQTDIVVDELNIVASDALLNATKTKKEVSKKDASEAGRTLFPIDIERVEIQNSRFDYRDLEIFISQINGRLSHVTASNNAPNRDITAELNVNGSLMGKTFTKILGHINLATTPNDWLFAVEFKKLKLPEVNKLITRFVPLTFKDGELDLYSEVKSENDVLTGYLKPFLRKADVVGNDNDFKGIKHFGVEITTAFLNLFFRSGRNHTVATKLLFSIKNDKFDWNFIEVLSELFKNGYQKELAPGIENRLSLDDHKTKDIPLRKN